jgi:hypothetical protein
MKKAFLVWLLFATGSIFNLLPAQEQKSLQLVSTPVFQVDVPDPTADKPQCKLWYMDGSWWALIPKSTGPSLWQRTESGWVEDKEVASLLAGAAGRTDVSVDKQGITAVGVGLNFLNVFRLDYTKKKWNARMLATLRATDENGDIETATIARDRLGRWWVASDFGERVCVWSGSKDGSEWEAPITLANGLHKDDICTIATLPDGVVVIWSDQVSDKVSSRFHKNGLPVKDWAEEVIIEAGNKTADDHLHTALAADGTLWLATKNSLDEKGRPQQVLRVRSPDGKWRNFPYANLDSVRQPSRPVVLVTQNPEVILAGHTIYHSKNPDQGEIVFGIVDINNTNILTHEKTVMAPGIEGARINNVTGPKDPFPKNAAWIVLASDGQGRVYEADLRELVTDRK